MTEKILWFIVGFIVARYLILNKFMNNYKEVEDNTIGTVKDNITSFLKDMFPEASEDEISETTEELTTVNK
jgi:hypothetical protein